VDFGAATFQDTWINQGPALAPHLLRFLSNALAVRVYYAELRDRHLGMVTSGPAAAGRGTEMIHEQLRPEAITVTPVSRLKHLVLGLSDRSRLLGVGTLESVDFRRRTLRVFTAIRGHGAVGLVQFGILRVRPDGVEMGSLRPGEV
jgi:polynucleotide 5'-kinase involved in rRNA processing